MPRKLESEENHRKDSAPNPANVSTAPDSRVLRELVKTVYVTNKSSITARLVAVPALGIFLYFGLHQRLALGFVLLHLLLYLHFYLAPHWERRLSAEESLEWAGRVVRNAWQLGIADVMVPWLFVSAGNLPVTAIVVVALMGACAHASQSLHPLKLAMFGYTLPMMGGLISSLLWQGESTCLVLAAFSLLYMFLMLRAGTQANRLLIESLTVRFEKEALATRLEDQIEATERASAEKSRFLAAASHDLRQPLHAIALFGAAMESALWDHPESRNAERLMRAVDVLGASLDTVLDVSRLDAGVVVPELRALELDVLFLTLNQTFTAHAEQKGVQLRVRASGLWVLSDLQLLYRMLSNLVDNALKYTQEGGVSVAARKRGEAVWVEVRDTGIGIAPEQLGRIFEEFYQVDNPGRDRARGLGIGLSIVKRLAHLLDHPVTVYSRPRRGTCFRLVVPVAKAIADPSTELFLHNFETPVRHRFAAPTLHGRVLLLDDETEIRAAMTELLRAHSIDIVAVADEMQAIEALAHPDARVAPFAMLLCDYRLANGEDGLEVGLRLRERFHLSAPLLLITGETAPERLQRARASGVAMLFKPVSAAMLLQAMAELASSAASHTNAAASRL